MALLEDMASSDSVLFYGETGVVVGIAGLAVARLWRLSMPIDAVALTVLVALGLVAVSSGPRTRTATCAVRVRGAREQLL